MMVTSHLMTSAMTSHLALLLLLTSSVHTAELQFTSSPPEIQTPITDSMDMRCSLSDVINIGATSATATTTVTSSGLVGRRDVADSSNHEDPTKNNKRDIQPTESIRQVVSLTIKRGGVAIATVSQYTAAVVESDLDKANLKVTGDVSKVKGQLGYLHLVWDFPKDVQGGEYECTAAAVTELGHFVTFTKSLTVQRASVDLKDLIREVSDLKHVVAVLNATDYEHKAKIANETAKNEQLQSTIDQLKSETTAHQTTIAQLQAKTNGQAATIAEMQKDVSSLSSDMHESRHVETGTINCGSSNHWPTGSGTATHNNYVNAHYTGLENHVKGSFHSKFSSPPVVFLSTSYLVVDFRHHVWYGIKLVNVTTEGFVVRCDTHTSNCLVQTLEVDWIAVPV